MCEIAMKICSLRKSPVHLQRVFLVFYSRDSCLLLLSFSSTSLMVWSLWHVPFQN
jgi:hypothetical protein